MGLETGNTIADINVNWPLGGSDPVSEGDDHFRFLKRVLTNDVVSRTGGGQMTGDLEWINNGNPVLANEVFLQGRDTGGSVRGLVKCNDDDHTQLGSTGTAANDYVTAGSGRHDFYCGTAALDATINSDGFYMFGSEGLNATGSLNAGVTIDPVTLAFSGGVQLHHAGSHASIANLDTGNIEFRFGGNATGDTVAKLTPAGNLSADGNVESGGYIGPLDATGTGNGIKVQSSAGATTNMYVTDVTGSGAGDFVMNMLGVGGGTNLYIDGATGGVGSWVSYLQANGNTKAAGAVDAQGGMRMAHGGSNGQLVNYGGGDIQFRFSNGSGGDAVQATIGPNGEINTNGAVITGTNVQLRGGDAQLNMFNTVLRIQNLVEGGIQLRGGVGGNNLFALSAEGVITSQGTLNNTNAGSTNMVRVASDGTFQNSSSLAQFKRIKGAVRSEYETGTVIDALEPIVYNSLFPNDPPAQLYAGFTVENVQQAYGLAVPTDDPTDYDIRAMLALAIAEIQSLRGRVGELELEQGGAPEPRAA